MEIEQFKPADLIEGLLDGEDYQHRVGGSCIYRCPRCGHGIRFKWHNFKEADERSFLKPEFRPRFDLLTAKKSPLEQGFLDFHCPTCKAPTRIIFSIDDYRTLAFHYDIDLILVGGRG